jgi:hypothetical protein
MTAMNGSEMKVSKHEVRLSRTHVRKLFLRIPRGFSQKWEFYAEKGG